MATNRPDPARDTWLTPGDAALLHTLADPLPTDVRRGLAQMLRRAGAVPDVVTASIRDRANQDYAALLHRLPAFTADLERLTARGTATPAQVDRATADLARYHTWAAGIADRHHVATELGQATHDELAHAQDVLTVLQRHTGDPRRLTVAAQAPDVPPPPRTAS